MFSQLTLTDLEKIISKSGLPAAQPSILAGAARAVRVSYDKRQPDMNNVYQLSAGLIAPLCFLFVWWTLQSALKNNIKRLYFLSRDGQVFFKVAKILVDAWGLDVELRYLYCSRESLLVPSFQKVDLFEKNWITWAYQGGITINEICARLNLTPDVLEPWLLACQIEDHLKNPDKVICGEDFVALRSSLEHPLFVEIVSDAIAPRYETTLGYLLQEGLGEGVDFALVDTGWTGSSQYALNSILRKKGLLSNRKITGYYLGVNREAYSTEGDLLEGFLFDWRSSRRDERLYNFICFELLFSGLHGRTIGYKKCENNFEPVLEGGLSGFPLAASEVHHKVAEEFADKVVKLIAFESFDSDSSSKLGRDLMLKFICWPSCSLAETYGEWPMASEIRESDSQRVAPPMDVRSFILFSLGRKKVQGYWPQASLSRNNKNIIKKSYNLFLRVGALEMYRRYILRY